MIRSAATYGLAWALKQVTLREVDREKRMARGVDTEGQHVEIRLGIRRSEIVPKVGQDWLIDRDFGVWTLNAFLEQGPANPSGGDWLPLTLLNDWEASESPQECQPEACVTPGGGIEVSGIIYGGTVPATGGVLTVAKLPDGFPAPYRQHAVLASSMPTSGGGYVRGSLLADGSITIAVSVAFTPAWVDLASLRGRVSA
ncbi:hypothetical protein [Streptomyces sp. NPDC088752]|uniref:hypothetical protein n=1 Tax=Streptomyces sp. NPDC088752 TaxID=3154963 RepID=UPI00343F4D22